MILFYFADNLGVFYSEVLVPAVWETIEHIWYKQISMME